MNISHEHKVIWWALESSGEDKMYEILKNYGFSVEKTENIAKTGLNYDHSVTESTQFPDYKVICTISNPYYRVFDLFLGFISPNKVIKKKFLPDLREKFNKFVEKSLKSGKLVVNPVDFLENESNDMKYFKKWVFDDKIPDYFVRIEHFYDDLGKIDFIDPIVDEKRIIYEDLYDYRSMYDFTTAKKVYHNLKKHFYLCDYDPFSFTHEELTKEDKISFLHGLL